MILSVAKKKGPKFIKHFIRDIKQKAPPPIYGLGKTSQNGHPDISNRPRHALLSFITSPFRLSFTDPQNLQFSLSGAARSIVQVLNDLGFVVDVVEWLDTKFKATKKYDLFIGHGGRNFKYISNQLHEDILKIYFSTGLYWKEHNRLELKRFDDLKKRKGVSLPYDRWIEDSEEYANQIADGIICLGNENVKASYSKFPLVINLNNGGYYDARYESIRKDFSAGRKHFLFFSGGGNVHKGLDLLLEAFTQLDANLYICQGIRKDFYDVYRYELEDVSNIHLIGPIDLKNKIFYELVDRCNFVIHPSCSEGQPGSVIDMMHQGLIPIVSHETHIDTNDFGITLNDCSIEEIKRTVSEVSSYSPVLCEKMSKKTRWVAKTEYSEDAFSENIKNAIKFIYHAI